MSPFAWLDGLGAVLANPGFLRAALEPDGIAEPLPAPLPEEWLAIREERGQSFDEFARCARRLQPAERTIYLQPLDAQGPLSATCMSTLASFTAAFFQRPVRVKAPLAADPRELVTRISPDTGRPQVYAGDLLARLNSDRPADALCVLGVTAHDLFPCPIVSFAFGEASADCRVGVVSVARYGPPYCEDATGRAPGEMRRRCCRVVAHEIGHMAGVAHCTRFRCLMNGSASLAESDRRPLHLCPADLRKLHWLMGFDLTERYSQLHRFWRGSGDAAEAAWAAGRLHAMTLRRVPRPARALLQRVLA